MPFFLFDLDKATTGGEGEHDARDFLKETFFTSFDQKRKKGMKDVGGAAMKGNTETKLANLLKQNGGADVIQHMKTLSPSGVELEIMTLANFDLGDEGTLNAEQKVSIQSSSLITFIDHSLLGHSSDRNQEAPRH